MTTAVIIKAHCSDDKEVHITIDECGDRVQSVEVIQDGEEFETYTYDDRVISVKEVKKQEDKTAEK